MAEHTDQIELDVRLANGASTLVSALRACMQAAGDERDLAEITGLTGLAFHLNLDPVVSPSSVAAYPWAQELPAMAARLGYELTLVYSDDEDPRLEVSRKRATKQAIDALWRGTPSIVWGVHLPEFGVVRGMRASTQELLVSGVLDDRGGPPSLHYEQLGRGDVPVLLVATMHRDPQVDPLLARIAALRHALRHARGVGPRLGGYACGLVAYAVWCEALDTGAVDPSGHAYTLQIAAELRAGAGPFLERTAEAVGGAAADHLRAAAVQYQRAADRLIALASETPFPPPEDYQLTATMRERAISTLEAVADSEQDAIERIEAALDHLRREHAAEGLAIHEATSNDAAALFHCAADIPIAEVADAAATERTRATAQLGSGLRAKLATTGDRVIGHLYYAPLESSGAAITVQDNRRYFYLYCPWVSAERRGSGIGDRLIEALVETAQAEDVAGIFADATYQDVFLHIESLAALGFEIFDRDADGAMMYRAVEQGAPKVQLVPPSSPTEGKLPVVAAQHRPCPLLACSQANMLTGARTALEQGAALELRERATPPNEITIGNRRLPLSYIPAAGAELVLVNAAADWSSAKKR